MLHPMLSTPYGVRKVINGVMQENSSICSASVNSMLSFFSKAASNFSAISAGTFYVDQDRISPALNQVIGILSNAFLVTDCSMVDPLIVDFKDITIKLDHTNIPCFMEKPNSEDPKRAIRIYFNAVDKFFLAIHIEYLGDAIPGPFSPYVLARHFRLYPSPASPELIFETMMTLLAPYEDEEDEFLHNIYRPVH